MALRTVWRPQRDEVVAVHGAVATKDPLATEVGLEVLKQGGNAVDAAVAVGFCLCVVEPMMTCIAGVGYMLIALPGRGEEVVIDYGPRAPMRARPDMYRVLGEAPALIGLYQVEGRANEVGYLSIGVPGTVAGLCLAHRLYGSLPLPFLLEPAIHYAEQGFEVNWYLALCISNAMSDFQVSPAACAVFLPRGRPPISSPKPAERLVQRDLAEVLKAIARHGSDAFYKGDIADAIEQDMRAHGGLMTRADLERYEAVVRAPLRVAWREVEVLAPWGANGAITALETLNILENFDLRALGHNTIDYLHTYAEAAGHAFADRYAYLGDPEAVAVPMRGLLSKEYARHISQTLRPDRTVLPLPPGQVPWAYYDSRPLHDPWAYEGHPRPATAPVPSAHGGGDCTTHFCIVDRERNLVSCTQTAVSLFGSKVVTPGTGILWNNAMLWFNPKPGTANSVAPWKRPLVNMTPLLVKHGGRPVMAIGAPGGRRIIDCNTQVFLNMVAFGMGPQEAVAQPRVDVSSGEVLLDSRLGEEVAQGLRQRGHRVVVAEETPADVNFATPLAIQVDVQNNLVRAGVDVFRRAEAMGY
ncbi:MAG: gamma-glutamyltransferase [Dehalococcoidia bacterium]|nr:gamma-glutamyltransferase [Dehalococcoidia bacterium]MDW8119435.1 gamma-glutamyltransferase [Chloroflexota bacterium]